MRERRCVVGVARHKSQRRNRLAHASKTVWKLSASWPSLCRSSPATRVGGGTAGGIYHCAKGEGRPARAPCTLRAPRHAQHSATTTYYAVRRTCGEGRGPCEEDGLLKRPRLGGGLLRGQHHRAHPTDDVLPASRNVVRVRAIGLGLGLGKRFRGSGSGSGWD